MATVYAGRLYPSRMVFATVVDPKGSQDDLAVSRLTAFIKETGYSQLVYKSDQESAITKMTDAAIRGSGRSGVPLESKEFESGLAQAVNEHSAVGQNASNGKAERTVQAVEDLLRTLKPALEARIEFKIPVTRPSLKWLVEHSATILNGFD